MPSIQDVMTTDLVQVGAQGTIREAATLMRDNEIGDVLVTGEDGSLVGIATDRDLVVHCLADGALPDSSISPACTTDPISVDISAQAGDAIRTMRENAIRRVPVVENGRAVGIVSIGDLASEYDKQSVLADISQAPPNS
ncbi:MAG: CBS domain-containing protein [Acidimicrobiia bacterium]|nr:CBS domain-containing protein [Acidimicrobiia bacterium]